MRYSDDKKGKTTFCMVEMVLIYISLLHVHKFHIQQSIYINKYDLRSKDQKKAKLV
jgi:hypothetical protein